MGNLIEQMRRHVASYKTLSPHRKNCLDLCDALGAAQQRVEELKPYRDAVDDAAIVTWTLNDNLTPKEQLAKIIEFEIQVATDPKVNGGKVLEDEQRIAELEALRSTGIASARIRKLEAENERLRSALEQLRMAESEAVRNHVEAALAAVEGKDDE